jgi:hypothetical protein
MDLLCDIGHLESHFNPFGDSGSVSARKAHGLRQMYHRHRNCFGRTRWYYLVTLVMWNLVLMHLEIAVLLVQDRCTVCAKRTIGTEIVSDAPDGNPRCRGLSGCSFWSVWR